MLRFAAHQLQFLVLFPSPRSAEYHKYKMMEKLNLKSSADLIRYAVKHSLL